MRAAVLSSILILGACATNANEDPLTQQEAEQAVDEVNLATSAQALTWELVEISTHFTAGVSLAEAGAELGAFAASQIPCAEVAVAGAVVTVDFGDLADGCTFRGKTFAGIARLEVERSEKNLLVHHTYAGLSDGVVQLNGSADVCWSETEPGRDVSYEMAFSRDDFARTYVATGDVTLRLLDPTRGSEGGVELEGTRMVRSDDRTWQLDLSGIELRGLDPVPQAGEYTLYLPSDKSAKMTFERVDATSVRVTVTGAGGRTFYVTVPSP